MKKKIFILIFNFIYYVFTIIALSALLYNFIENKFLRIIIATALSQAIRVVFIYGYRFNTLFIRKKRKGVGLKVNKYKIGKRIKSLKELSKQEFIYFKPTSYAKIISRGWWQNWQFRTIEQYISLGYLYKAVPTKEYKKELKAGRKIVDRLIEIPSRLPF